MSNIRQRPLHRQITQIMDIMSLYLQHSVLLLCL